MRRTRWEWLAGSLLIGGFLTFAGLFNLDLVSRPAFASELTSDAPAERVRPPIDGHEYVLPWPDVMRVNLDVFVDGRRVPTVRHMGRTYLPVPRLGAEYELRVDNHGPRRITAIVSVDGLSVITGRPASEDDAGYIVAPGNHIVIKGWRRNRETVAAFSFEEREKSYASRTGHPENIGVIGLVAFEEMSWRPRPIPLTEAPDRARASSKVGGTGTGYGQDVDSPVHEVPFVRSPNRRAATILYDTADALRQAGVPVDQPSPVPFPRGE